MRPGSIGVPLPLLKKNGEKAKSNIAEPIRTRRYRLPHFPLLTMYRAKVLHWKTERQKKGDCNQVCTSRCVSTCPDPHGAILCRQAGGHQAPATIVKFYTVAGAPAKRSRQTSRRAQYMLKRFSLDRSCRTRVRAYFGTLRLLTPHKQTFQRLYQISPNNPFGTSNLDGSAYIKLFV